MRITNVKNIKNWTCPNCKVENAFFLTKCSYCDHRPGLEPSAMAINNPKPNNFPSNDAKEPIPKRVLENV